MILRRAQPTDAGSVGAILSQFIDTTDWIPRVHTRAEDLAHAGELVRRGWVDVAEMEGRVVGFSACNAAELNALYVAQAARDMGVGTALLRALQQREAHLTLWTFQANTAAQRFYLRHGFEEMERTDGGGNDEGLPDIRYDWYARGG